MKRFNSILCAVEPDELSKTAIVKASVLAKQNQASLSIISVVKKSGAKVFFSDNDLDSFILGKQTYLEQFVNEHYPELDIEITVLVGIPFIEIIKQVMRHDHDLLVKCCGSQGLVDRLFSSNDMHLLRKCPCPVLMLKPGHVEPSANILATVDLSDNTDLQSGGTTVHAQLNELVLDYSLTFALAELAEFHIGSVWEGFGEDYLRHSAFSNVSKEKVDQYALETKSEYELKLANLIDSFQSEAGKETLDYIRPITHLVKGQPKKDIPKMVQKYDIDLIVMGTVARIGVPGLFIGNTAEEILNQVHCSVLAIKPPGFETPIAL
jgi:nucleotide-binding universal stress UspA family protein